jgi:hypothetical protein
MARVIVANPLQVKVIAHARVKTDKIDAGVLASLRAAFAGAQLGGAVRRGWRNAAAGNIAVSNRKRQTRGASLGAPHRRNSRLRSGYALPAFFHPD